jgi:hypothetical protein
MVSIQNQQHWRLNPRMAISDIGSVFRSIRREYLGWREFHRVTGLWPAWSMAASVTTLPAFFALGLYVLVASLNTRRLWLIYSTLLCAVIGLPLLWFGLRRLANRSDAERAKRLSTEQISEDVEQLIR